jgi:hypothetical protein
MGMKHPRAQGKPCFIFGEGSEKISGGPIKWLILEKSFWKRKEKLCVLLLTS